MRTLFFIIVAVLSVFGGYYNATKPNTEIEIIGVYNSDNDIPVIHLIKKEKKND